MRHQFKNIYIFFSACVYTVSFVHSQTKSNKILAIKIIWIELNKWKKTTKLLLISIVFVIFLKITQFFFSSLYFMNEYFVFSCFALSLSSWIRWEKYLLFLNLMCYFYFRERENRFFFFLFLAFIKLQLIYDLLLLLFRFVHMPVTNDKVIIFERKENNILLFSIFGANARTHIVFMLLLLLLLLLL